MNVTHDMHPKIMATIAAINMFLLQDDFDLIPSLIIQQINFSAAYFLYLHLTICIFLLYTLSSGKMEKPFTMCLHENKNCERDVHARI